MAMELAIKNLHLLVRALHAHWDIYQPQPSQTSWHLSDLMYYAQYAGGCECVNKTRRISTCLSTGYGDVELAIGNPHLLARALHSRLNIYQPQPSQTSWHLSDLE